MRSGGWLDMSRDQLVCFPAKGGAAYTHRFPTNPQTADRLLLVLYRNNYRIMCPQYADPSAPNTPRNGRFCAPSSPRKSQSSTGACGKLTGSAPRMPNGPEDRF